MNEVLFIIVLVVLEVLMFGGIGAWCWHDAKRVRNKHYTGYQDWQTSAEDQLRRYFTDPPRSER